MTAPSADFIALQAALAGEYSLRHEVGRGGMGVVYLARDVQLDRDVAIKMLPSALASAESRHRFLREARTAAGLSHPHIVPIHRVGEANGLVFFVMSYVEGETLGERLRTRGPLAPAEATRVLREVAWALAYAHSRGIVHRDVKPDNILLEAGTGRALVTDFGIAHGIVPRHAREVAATDAGMIMGTTQFMSPEQAMNAPIDGRSDIYALGVVGYLAVSGRLPLAASMEPAVRVAPGLPPLLGAAIDRCLQRDPADRFADGETLAAALTPAPPERTVLPPALRAWLGVQNPLLVPYLGWAGVFSTMSVANLVVWVTGNRPDGPADIVLLAAIAALPLLPIVGFHANQAQRQFRAGHTLADLRAALDIARRESVAADALVGGDHRTPVHRVLRAATVFSAAWLAVTFGLVLQGTIGERQGGPILFLAPLLTTMLLGAISNALDVGFIPSKIRGWWRTGVRERLWTSRAGEWLARRLGAPTRSRAIDGGIFRATEAVLGVAASELFGALPAAYRTQLAELPAVVNALEAGAAGARAELAVLDALATDALGARVLTARREAATALLTQSVAALEALRLDLLRLHAGSSDLAPLTTLINAAGRIGDHIHHLADAVHTLDAAASTSAVQPERR